ncbi:glycoprotein-N-acetylgalactosamine 3-beta-galactosyltransferase 1-like [Culicoides brevitarsis]|uniref:glycoprotein-N-acetylgalactosamine 3-beta-galactosyltransferase 1-like n=1 Tax=Culicoides brevitarsis TaxID=469753 RepID=UPI00307B4129
MMFQMSKISVKNYQIILFVVAFGISVAIKIIQIVITDMNAFQSSYYDVMDYSSIKLQSNVLLDTRAADYATKEVKVLCWIETYPKNFREKAIHIQRTWGKRCDKTIYVTTQVENDVVAGTVEDAEVLPLNITEGYEYLWTKTTHALRVIHDRYIDNFDWFFKADDDTFVIVENLRHFLLPHSPTKLLVFGCLLKNPNENVFYHSGGSGYVMSRAALRTLRIDGFTNPEICPPADELKPEDVALGICFRNLGVQMEDTRDDRGRLRFAVERPEFHLTTDQHESFWFYERSFQYVGLGFECCSHRPVTFHYVTPERMYLFDALLYRVFPYGVRYEENHLNKTDNLMKNK